MCCLFARPPGKSRRTGRTGVEARSTTTRDERDGFAELYREHRAPLYAFCLARTRDPVLAEDIVQDAFAEAFALRSRFDDRRPFWPWLASIAARRCIDAYRRRAYARSQLAHMAPPGPADLDPTATAALDHMALARIDRLVAELPTRQRLALWLSAVEGRSYADIAAALGTSVGTVKMLVLRARRTAREAGTRVLGGLGVTLRSLHRRQQALGLWDGTWWASLQSLSAQTAPAAMVIVALAAAIGPMGRATGTTPATAGDGAQEPVAFVGTAVEAPSPGTRPDAVPSSRSATGSVEHAAHQAAAPLLYQPTDAPDDVSGYSLAVSPSYEEDHTIFASMSVPAGHGPAPLLVSRDGGASWTSLFPRGLLGGARLLLPPAYPRDNRIFAVDAGALRVSHDGGRSFETLVALPAIQDIAVSPVYERGDRAMLLVAGGQVFEFREGHAALHPLALPLAPAGHLIVSARYALGYPADPTILLGSQEKRVAGGRAWVHRCRRDAPGTLHHCTSHPFPWFDGGGMTLLVSPRAQPGLVYVGGNPGRYAYVSTDEGRTFRQVVTDPHVLVVGMDAIPSPTGTSAVMARWRSVYDPVRRTWSRGPSLMRTGDGGGTWAPLPVELAGFEEHFDVRAVAVTPTGRIVALGAGRGIVCSVDDGATWGWGCPRAEASSR